MVEPGPGWVVPPWSSVVGVAPVVGVVPVPGVVPVVVGVVFPGGRVGAGRGGLRPARRRRDDGQGRGVSLHVHVARALRRQQSAESDHDHERADDAARNREPAPSSGPVECGAHAPEHRVGIEIVGRDRTEITRDRVVERVARIAIHSCGSRLPRSVWRAAWRWYFTAPSERCIASAISSTERSSM